VKREKRDLDVGSAQSEEWIRPGAEHDGGHVVPEALERALHGLSTLERNLALRRDPTHYDTDASRTHRRASMAGRSPIRDER
jgi:hypothetical protein